MTGRVNARRVTARNPVRCVTLASYDPGRLTWTFTLDCGHLEQRAELVPRRWHAVPDRFPCTTCGKGEA